MKEFWGKIIRATRVVSESVKAIQHQNPAFEIDRKQRLHEAKIEKRGKRHSFRRTHSAAERKPGDLSPVARFRITGTECLGF